MHTIDSVGIEITADAQGANNSLKELSKNLSAVKGSLKGFDSKSFIQMSQSLNRATQSMDMLMSKLKTMNATGVKPKVDTSEMNKAEKFISSKTDSIRRELAGLAPYAEAAMSGDKNAVSSFERKAMSIRSAIAQVKAELGKLGDTRIENPQLISVREKIAETTSTLASLKSEAAGFSDAMKFDNSQWDELEAKIKETEAELESLKAKEQEVLSTEGATIDPFANVRQSIGQFEGDLNRVSSDVKKTSGEVKKEPIKPKVDKSELKSLMSTLGEVRKGFASAKGILSGIGGSITKPFSLTKGAVDGIRGAFDKLHGFLNKGFMKVLRYGFGIRSLYVLFRRLKQAVIDSFGELQKSGAFVQETKSNIEGLKASLTTLKFQFGAAFQPIFNAIAPALQTLINYLVSVMNVISAFTAKLMGKSTYSKAVASTGAIAGNMGSAAGSAKELNKQLQGFDELNNLTSNSPGGGGGGGGGGGAGSGANYVTESVDSVLGDFAKELAEKIKQGDWEGVGRAISDKLVEAMQSIDWNKIYEKAKGFGKGLADFLNGLITPELFGELGKTLANALNTAFYALLEFGKTFDWKNLGESIATGINEFFTNADFAAWGETVHTWLSGILDAGITLVEETDWGKIGEKLADFFNNLDPIDIINKFAEFTHKLWNGIKELFASLWKNLGDDIKQGIKDYIVEALSWMPSNAPLILAWSNYLADFVGSVIEAIVVAFKGIGSEIKNSFNKLITGGGTTTGYNGMPSDVANKMFGSKGLVDYGKNIVEGIKEGFKKAVSLFDGVKLLWDKIVDDFYTIFGERSPAKKMYPYGANIFYGILKGFQQALKKSGNFVQELWELITGGGGSGQREGNGKNKVDFEVTLSGVVNSVMDIDNLKTKYNNLKTSWQGKKAELNAKVTGAVNSVKEIVEASGIYKTFKSGWTGAKAKFEASVGNQISKITDLDTWRDKVEKLTKKWKDDSATFKANTGGQITKIGDLNTWKTTIGKVYKAWKGKTAQYNFHSNTNANTMDAYGAAMDRLHGKWYGATATFGVTSNINDSMINEMTNRLEGLRRDLEESVKKAQSIIYGLNPSKNRAASGGGWITANNSGGFASGGIIRTNSFSRFANGGRPHGTMFLAGEAGPEIVGHIGGRTEVLNKSQLATVMTHAVRLGMQSIYPTSIQMEMPRANYSTFTPSGYASSDYNDAIARQNALLEEQNRLLRQIADKDPNIKVQDVFDATRKGATEYYNRTGNSPFLF